MSIDNYPIGAKDDPDAPWNREEPDQDIDVDINSYGEIEIIKRIWTGQDEFEADKETIDPYYIDRFLAKKFHLDFEEMEQNGKTIEINSIKEEGNEVYILDTSEGVISITLEELEDLL